MMFAKIQGEKDKKFVMMMMMMIRSDGRGPQA